MFRQPQQYFMKSGKGFVCGVAFLAFFASLIWVVQEAAGAEALQLQVAGLKANEVIPQKFVYNHSGCSGDNISPEITWNGVPASAKSRYHFILYALGVTQLPATIKTRVSDAAAQIKQAAVANTEVVLVYGH